MRLSSLCRSAFPAASSDRALPLPALWWSSSYRRLETAIPEFRTAAEEGEARHERRGQAPELPRLKAEPS